MNAILGAIGEFGLPTVAGAVLIFILVKGEFVFRYPRRNNLEK